MALNKAKTECILRAAGVVFSREGFSRSTMDAIAQEAQVSKATLYTHFNGKEGLFNAAVQTATEQFVLDMDIDALLALPLRQALMQLATHYLSFMFKPETLDFVRAVIGESGRHAQLGQQFYKKGAEIGRNAVLVFLKRHPELSYLQPENLESLSTLFVVLIKGDLQFRALLGIQNSKQDLMRQSNDCVDNFLKLLPEKDAI